MCSRNMEPVRITLDTVLIEPEKRQFNLTWRVARPIKKSLFEIAQVVVGKKGREWWQQRERVSFPLPVIMVPMEPNNAPAEGTP